MKLVELLARELSEWPEEWVSAAQDGNSKIAGFTTSDLFCNDGNDWRAEPTQGHYIGLSRTVLGDQELSSDYATAIVTKTQWQAERDRQKGGEWKRHRGSYATCKLSERVEVKLRCGDIQQGYAHEFLWRHADCDVSANIMQYRVISQPQAEEVEMKGPFVAKAANQESTEIKLDDFIKSGTWYEDQIDGPIKWRDTVNELDAYIEEFTRERESLINRLALEGFALIPAMTAVMGVADVDMGDWRNWKVGDVFENIGDCEYFTKGKQYTVNDLRDDHAQIKAIDDQGDEYPLMMNEVMFIRRP